MVEDGDPDTLSGQISSIDRTYDELMLPLSATRTSFDESYTGRNSPEGDYERIFADFDGWLTSSTPDKILIEMLKNVQPTTEPKHGIEEINVELIDEHLLRIAAFMASKIASVASVTMNFGRDDEETEIRTFRRLSGRLTDLWTRLLMNQPDQEEGSEWIDVYTSLLYRSNRTRPARVPPQLLKNDATGILLRLALMTALVNANARE
tara:strand:+ start:310 stop:930 length:621 start_codon:yes stop_codon:yes gene_type:complete